MLHRIRAAIRFFYIDLAWAATGPLDHSDRWHNKHFLAEPPCHINELGTITGRLAQVTGSITDGTTNFIAGLNTAYARLIRFRSTTVGRGDGDECL